MPTRTFMYWNIENFGAGKRGKYTVTGPQLVNFIANVIIRNNVSLFAMNEVRSSLGNQLGLDLAFALNSVQVTANWTHHASPKFMKGRDEQYLFLWRRDWIGNTNFVWAFDNPSSPPPLLGFPTQVTTAWPPSTRPVPATSTASSARATTWRRSRTSSPRPATTAWSSWATAT